MCICMMFHTCFFVLFFCEYSISEKNSRLVEINIPFLLILLINILRNSRYRNKNRFMFTLSGRQIRLSCGANALALISAQ